MSSQLERTLQANVVAWARVHRFLSVKVHERYQVGWPDRIFIAPNGNIVWMEFKAPGKRPTLLQTRIHRELAARNQRVYTVTTRHEAIQLLQDALDSTRVSEGSD